MNAPYGQYGISERDEWKRAHDKPMPRLEDLRHLTLDMGPVSEAGQILPSMRTGRYFNWGGYGAASTWDTVLQAIPGVGAFLEKISDPIREAQTLQAKLAAAKQRGASLQEIQALEGKLVAAQHRASLQLSREKSSSQRGNIGKVDALGGILLIGSLMFLVVVNAVKAVGKR